MRVTELALDDNEWNSFMSHLDSVGVSELVRCESTAHAGHGGGSFELTAG